MVYYKPVIRKTFVVCLALSAALQGLSSECTALEIPDYAESRLPHITWPVPVDSGELQGISVHNLGKLYRTPLCIEFPFPYKPTPVPGYGIESATTHKEDTFGQAINKVVASSNGKLVFERHHSMYCIVPSDEQSKSTGSNMVRRISLDVEKVSTWEAIKTVILEANKRPVDGRKLYVGHSLFRPYNFPPKGFVDDKSISLKLDNVTVREALCAILAESPLSISYRYIHGTSDSAELTFHTFEKRRGQSKFFTKGNWWRAEVASINQSEEVADSILSINYYFYAFVAFAMSLVSLKLIIRLKRGKKRSGG